MRLILTIRGTNVLDVELRWPSSSNDDPPPPKLEASGGGQAERAETYGDPGTTVGFGFTTSQ